MAKGTRLSKHRDSTEQSYHRQNVWERASLGRPQCPSAAEGSSEEADGGHYAALTFGILVEARDIHAGVAPHRLCADTPPDLLRVRIHTFPALILIPEPGDIVCIDLRKHKRAIMGQVHVTLSDGSDRGRAALEHAWAGGVGVSSMGEEKRGPGTHPAEPVPSLSSWGVASRTCQPL